MRQAPSWLKFVIASIICAQPWKVNAAAVHQPPTRTVASAVLRIPAGPSTWQQEIMPPVSLGAFMVQWEISPTCQGFGVLVEVQDATNGGWYTAQADNNIFYADIQLVSSVRYNFQQYAFPVAICRIHLARIESRQPIPPSRPTLVGLLNYTGGFIEHASTQLTMPTLARRLAVVIPNYCLDLQVLSGRLQTRDRVVEARVLGGNPLQLSSAVALVIEAIDLTLIGPKNQTCELPIYAYAPNDPVRPAKALAGQTFHELSTVEAELIAESSP